MIEVAALTGLGAAAIAAYRARRARRRDLLAEVHRIRVESAAAERRMHDLTRAAFIAMAERAAELHAIQPRREEGRHG